MDAFEWPIFREQRGRKLLGYRAAGSWTVEVSSSASFANISRLVRTLCPPHTPYAHHTPSVACHAVCMCRSLRSLCRSFRVPIGLCAVPIGCRYRIGCLCVAMCAPICSAFAEPIGCCKLVRSVLVVQVATPIAYQTPAPGRSLINYITREPLPARGYNCILAGHTFLVGVLPKALDLQLADFPKGKEIEVSFLNTKLVEANYPARALTYQTGVHSNPPLPYQPIPIGGTFG